MPVQVRPMKRESFRFWRTIRYLRGIGFPVTRAGRHHKVGGRLFSTGELRSFARQFGAE